LYKQYRNDYPISKTVNRLPITKHSSHMTGKRADIAKNNLQVSQPLFYPETHLKLRQRRGHLLSFLSSALGGALINFVEDVATVHWGLSHLGTPNSSNF
jgi:hypothetical protein